MAAFSDFIGDYLFEDPIPENFGLDPSDEDFSYQEWQKAVDFVKNLAYCVEEGLIEAEVDDDGEYRFFPPK